MNTRKKFKHISLDTPLREFESDYTFYECTVSDLAAKGIYTIRDLCLMPYELRKQKPRQSSHEIEVLEEGLSKYGLALGMDAKELEIYEHEPVVVIGSIIWEQRRYDIATEIFLSRLTDDPKASAAFAVQAADSLIEALRTAPQDTISE